MDIRNYKDVQTRRKSIEQFLGISLETIGQHTLPEEYVVSHNCENMIGAIQVPVGVVGPLLIKSDNVHEEVYVPLATTEGALIASVNRGAKAISESNGAAAVGKKVGITRSPVFTLIDIVSAKEFIQWVEEHEKDIKRTAEATSSHVTLLGIRSWHSGKRVFLRFSFDSQDAMGMNMATIATEKVCEYIASVTGVLSDAVSSNLCVDKKPNFLNFLEGRGIQVWADVVIANQTIETTLKTTAEKLVNTANSKLIAGSRMSGSIGANAQMANVLSALFLSTGQDIAHVAECAMGITEVEKTDGGVYFSIFLPDLVIGTVGGGTMLPMQKEALSIMKITGGNNGKNALRLAYIMAAAVLAGEISLLAALSSNDLALAHKKHGRGGK